LILLCAISIAVLAISSYRIFGQEQQLGTRKHNTSFSGYKFFRMNRFVSYSQFRENICRCSAPHLFILTVFYKGFGALHLI